MKLSLKSPKQLRQLISRSSSIRDRLTIENTKLRSVAKIEPTRAKRRVRSIHPTTISATIATTVRGVKKSVLSFTLPSAMKTSPSEIRAKAKRASILEERTEIESKRLRKRVSVAEELPQL